MVFSLEHDIKVTKNHQNLLPTQSVLVAHTVVYLCIFCAFLAKKCEYICAYFLHFPVHIIRALPITKTKVPREFTVTKGHFKDLNLVDMVRKYATLRASHTPHARLFINYKKGRCTVQPVGINGYLRWSPK
jgi:hypothetical protein